MTEKELLYFDDAIAHEKNMIKICSYLSEELNDIKLSNFIKKELNFHNDTYNELISFMEVKSNE